MTKRKRNPAATWTAIIASSALVALGGCSKSESGNASPAPETVSARESAAQPKPAATNAPVKLGGVMTAEEMKKLQKSRKNLINRPDPL